MSDWGRHDDFLRRLREEADAQEREGRESAAALLREAAEKIDADFHEFLEVGEYDE